MGVSLARPATTDAAYSRSVTQHPAPYEPELQPDPLAEAQEPVRLYVTGGVAAVVAVAAVAGGRVVGGWSGVGCYVIGGAAALYGCHVLVLGVGWRFASKALTRSVTDAAHREAAARGRRVVELRFSAPHDDPGVAIDRLMEAISTTLGDSGECEHAQSTGFDHRLFIEATDVQVAVDVVRRAAKGHPLPASAYLWVPDATRYRFGQRLTL